MLPVRQTHSAGIERTYSNDSAGPSSAPTASIALPVRTTSSDGPPPVAQYRHNDADTPLSEEYIAAEKFLFAETPDYAQAYTSLKAIFDQGPEHPDYYNAFCSLGLCLKAEDAYTFYTENISLITQDYHQIYRAAHSNLAAVCNHLGKYAETIYYAKIAMDSTVEDAIYLRAQVHHAKAQAQLTGAVVAVPAPAAPETPGFHSQLTAALVDASSALSEMELRVPAYNPVGISVDEDEPKKLSPLQLQSAPALDPDLLEWLAFCDAQDQDRSPQPQTSDSLTPGGSPYPS